MSRTRILVMLAALHAVLYAVDTLAFGGDLRQNVDKYLAGLFGAAAALAIHHLYGPGTRR